VIKHCFEELKLDLIWCGYFDFNENSKRVVEKCGFNYQFTTNKKLSQLDNQETKMLHYNITKEVFLNR